MSVHSLIPRPLGMRRMTAPLVPLVHLCVMSSFRIYLPLSDTFVPFEPSMVSTLLCVCGSLGVRVGCPC